MEFINLFKILGLMDNYITMQMLIKVDGLLHMTLIKY